MKRSLITLMILALMISCEKEPHQDTQNSQQRLLQEQVFNGNSRWAVSRMEADTEREIHGKTTTEWSREFADCRKDNVYIFGNLPIEVASIHIDEGDIVCDPEEPDYVPQGLFLQFSTDYNKAAVSVRGAAMAKLFDLPYDNRTKLNGFEHSWEFEEVSSDQLVVKALIPADQSAGMTANATTVHITFERLP